MDDPIAELRYEGEIAVRPYRRGTYLGTRHLEEAIERALTGRYSYGSGWRGYAVLTIRFYDRVPAGDEEAE
jgi:hypothetical protein